MLTNVDERALAGTNGIEHDAVELPSQFMENWCYHKPTLVGMSQHMHTGEPLPDDLFNKIVGSRNLFAAMLMMRQLFFCYVDMEVG